MIVSHRHGFIFLKTRKTAGTSVEVFLSGVCGENDIVTPIFPPERGHTARNHDGFYNHMPAWEARRSLGESVWNSYFKFCVERNPWDKVVSHFFWCRSGLDFRSFVRSRSCAAAGDGEGRAIHACRELPVDGHIYTDGGVPVVDRILRYEDLESGLGGVMSRIGVGFDGLVPRAKSGFRRVADYRRMYDEESRETVRAAFSREVRMMGYSF